MSDSASHDQTAMLWEWNVTSNSVDCVHICRGHERGLECVATDGEGTKVATGGWDALLKIWSAGQLKLYKKPELVFSIQY